MPRLIEVIESEIPRGNGTLVDRHRTVRQYHTRDGEMLAESDPCKALEHRWIGPVAVMPQNPSPLLLRAIVGEIESGNGTTRSIYAAIYGALAERPELAESREASA